MPPAALGGAGSPPSPLSSSQNGERGSEKPTPAQEKQAAKLMAQLRSSTPDNRMVQVDKSRVNPQILAAAQGMEAMFLDYMMKTMRQTVPKNEMDLESPATEVYRNMMDTETAQKAARAGGIGLADQIVAYLDPQSYNLRRAEAAQQVPSQPSGHDAPGTRVAPKASAPATLSTGGTDEGRPNRN